MVCLFPVAYFYDNIVMPEQTRLVDYVPIFQPHFWFLKWFQGCQYHFIRFRMDFFYENSTIQLNAQSSTLANRIKRISLVPSYKIAAFIEESSSLYFSVYVTVLISGLITKTFLQKATIIERTKTNTDTIFLFRDLFKSPPGGISTCFRLSHSTHRE